MARKKKVTAKVISQKQIAEQIFDLLLETRLAKDAHPGQFVAVYPKGESTLLPARSASVRRMPTRGCCGLSIVWQEKARRSFRPARPVIRWISSAYWETASLSIRRKGNASF